MKRLLFLTCLLCAAALILHSCARSSPPTQTTVSAPQSATDGVSGTQLQTAPPEKTTQAPAVQRDYTQLQAQIDGVFRQYGTVGAQVTIIRDGAVQADFCFGFADRERKTAVQRDTKFRCASLSKLIAAMTVMSVCETDAFDLQKDVGSYLHCTVRNPNYPDVPITSAMLMTHTSSVTDSSAFLDSRNASSKVPLSDLLSRRSTYAKAKPGAAYSYSNFGVAILADAAECLTGKDFDTLARERLFSPLGVDASYLASNLREPALTANLYDAHGNLQLSAQRQLQTAQSRQLGQTHHLYQGNLTVSASDYARLLCVLLNGGHAADTTILQPQSVQQILSVQFASPQVRQGYCIKQLDHVVDGRTMWGHTGLNYGVYTSFAIDPADRSGVVVFTSGADAALDNDSQLFDVCTQIIRLCCAQE